MRQKKNKGEYSFIDLKESRETLIQRLTVHLRFLFQLMETLHLNENFDEQIYPNGLKTFRLKAGRENQISRLIMPESLF